MLETEACLIFLLSGDLMVDWWIGWLNGWSFDRWMVDGYMDILIAWLVCWLSHVYTHIIYWYVLSIYSDTWYLLYYHTTVIIEALPWSCRLPGVSPSPNRWFCVPSHELVPRSVLTTRFSTCSWACFVQEAERPCFFCPPESPPIPQGEHFVFF